MRISDWSSDVCSSDLPVQQEANVGKLIQRIYDLGANTVFLQAFADPKGDGLVHSLYFPNRHLPVRGDLFDRVAWQLKTRANAKELGSAPRRERVSPYV